MSSLPLLQRLVTEALVDLRVACAKDLAVLRGHAKTMRVSVLRANAEILKGALTVIDSEIAAADREEPPPAPPAKPTTIEIE